MRMFRFLFAIFALIWTVGIAVGVVSNLGVVSSPQGQTELAGGVAATLVFAAITFWLFAGAFRKPKPTE